jgi:Tfp pilus assembly protein PilN
MASNGVRTPSKSDTTGYHDIHIDLLAARKQTLARPLSIRKVLTPIAVVGAIAILVPVSLLHTRAVSETAGLQMQLDNLNYNLYQERQALAEAEITQMEIDTLEMETATLQKERESLSGRGSLSKIIQFIISSLPAQATCTGINTSPEQLEVNGTAAERQGVLDYARTLEQKGQFTSVRISLIDETASEKDQGTGEITVFKIIIQR